MNNMKHKSRYSSPNFDGLPIFTNAFQIWMKILNLKALNFIIVPTNVELETFHFKP
jgi:hypothetical protein